MLQPKRTKFRKQQKGKNRGVAWRGSDVSFGDFGLQATEHSFVTSRQIEACRMAIQRHVKRAGKLWIRVFPDKPVTKTAWIWPWSEVRINREHLIRVLVEVRGERPVTVLLPYITMTSG